MKLMNEEGLIICGFSGIGKTTLGQKYDNVAEIGQSLYRSIFLDEQAYTMDRELRKNIRTGKLPNPEWPLNYINKINELRTTHDFVLVFTDLELMDALRQHNIPFMIALPEIGQKQEFLKRFKKRGQDKVFIEKANELWEIMLQELMTMKEPKIIVRKGHFLEDELKNRGYKFQ